MATTGDRWTAKNLLAAFDEHLHRVRGVCPGTRRNYGRYAGAFLGLSSPAARWTSRRSALGTWPASSVA